MPSVPLDRWNRNLIVPEGGDKRVPHTRPTTLAKTIEDTYNLERWRQCRLADGLAKRADLVASVAAARGDNERLHEICEQAIEVTGASSSAILGTALHSFYEQADRDELSVDDIDEPWASDVRAYRSALEKSGLAVVLVEEVVVLPGLMVAGTVDRVVECEGRYFVLDIKTGQDLRHGLAGFAVQLACYAHASTIYDPTEDTHRPMPKVSKELGIIAHVPAGKGTCALSGIDLDTGWRGAQLAYAVREYRKTVFLRKWGVDAVTERKEWLVRQVRRLMEDYPDAARDLAQLWPVDVPTLRNDGHTPEQLDEIAAVLQQVEGAHRIPFGDGPDPAHTISGGKKPKQ